MKSIQVPRDITETHRRNPQITNLCENLLLSYFDHDNTGTPIHIWDLTKWVFPQLSRSYPEIKTTKQTEIYVFWALKTICWNNRAKMTAPDWFENILTDTEAINESLPYDAPWENRMMGNFGFRTDEQKRDWKRSLEMAIVAVKQLKTFFGQWDDQKIIDTLYNGATKYAPRTVESALRYVNGLTE